MCADANAFFGVMHAAAVGGSGSVKSAWLFTSPLAFSEAGFLEIDIVS
jgi:hypothetical protein